jgi:hypothetical protein
LALLNPLFNDIYSVKSPCAHCGSKNPTDGGENGLNKEFFGIEHMIMPPFFENHYVYNKFY